MILKNKMDNIERVKISMNMMRLSARSSIATMEILKENQTCAVSDWHFPYYILAVNALEILAKIILIRGQIESVDINDLDKILRDFGHDLGQLYSENGIGLNLLQEIGILKVEKVKDTEQFIFHYAFYLIDEPDNPIYIYEMESLRYGLISEYKSNMGFVGYQFERLFELCKKIRDIEVTIDK